MLLRRGDILLPVSDWKEQLSLLLALRYRNPVPSSLHFISEYSERNRVPGKRLGTTFL
jgi:hypothetical protein